jgi:isopentenyl-diphosphate delta-isomerase
MSQEQFIAAWDQGQLRPVEKLDVHRRGLRHPAVSVLVFNGADLLIQKRAAGKYHSPGLWANTCCTHPERGEDMHVCAIRRLYQELGLTGIDLSPAGQITYRADVGQGLTEHEDVTVFVSHLSTRPKLKPNPAEVAATDWLSQSRILARMATHRDDFTAWFRIYVTEHSARLFPPPPDQG